MSLNKRLGRLEGLFSPGELPRFEVWHREAEEMVSADGERLPAAEFARRHGSDTFSLNITRPDADDEEESTTWRETS